MNQPAASPLTSIRLLISSVALMLPFLSNYGCNCPGATKEVPSLIAAEPLTASSLLPSPPPPRTSGHRVRLRAELAETASQPAPARRKRHNDVVCVRMINMHARVWSSPRRSQSHISIRWFHRREEKMSLCKTVINLWCQRNVFSPVERVRVGHFKQRRESRVMCSNDEGCVCVCTRKRQAGGWCRGSLWCWDLRQL